ncbi:MAG: DUF3108 domain-containing protein [Chitinispirillaceae bacterium]
MSNPTKLLPAKFLLPTLLLLALFSGGAYAKDDDIKWEDASKEVDYLPYPQTFIDSVENHLRVNRVRGALQKVKAGSFSKGEKLVYEIVWGPFKAGYVILNAQPHPQTGTIRLGAKAVSNNFVSAFYKMRDYIISWVDAEGLYPHFFEQHLREGKYKMDGFILYDNVGEKVFVQEKKSRVFRAPKFTHDYISVLYYVRSMELKKGDQFSINMFIHSKIHPIRFNIRGKEDVEVTAGKFRCIKLEPKLAGKGRAFTKKDKMQVWLTDDKHKIPVMIKSKIKVGSITAKLIHYEQN